MRYGVGNEQNGLNSRGHCQRWAKLKQKVSGCFRGDDGAKAFAIIRSYLSTLRKQSVDVYQALVMTFQGNPPMPRLP